MSSLLSSYVSRVVLERLASEEARQGPAASYVLGAVMLTDIEGFTARVEKSLGSREAFEELTQAFNAYFRCLVETVHANGGDVLTVAGDSFFCFWSAPDEAALSEAVLRAAQTGLEVQRNLDRLQARAGESFSTRIGIGTGKATFAFVGGLGGKWELVAAGPPVRHAAEVERGAPAGQVALHPESWQLVRGRCAGRRLDETVYVLDQVLKPVAPGAAPALPQVPEEVLRQWLPHRLVTDLDHSRQEWLAEIRRVTVVVTQLREIVDVTPEMVEEFDLQVRALQEIARRYEGTVRLTLDDKGILAILVFGLPGSAHDDDAERAIQASQELRRVFADLGVGSGIGICSGRAFCGTFGNDIRRDYTLHGDVINVAAGLMQSARREILCHQATAEAVRGRYTFEVLPPIAVKGKSLPIHAYHPLGRVRRRPPSESPLVGRDLELEVLAARLGRIRVGEHAGIVVIHGEAGIGKSRLLAEVFRRGRESGVRVLGATGDRVERSTPYFAWRSIFNSVFGILPGTPPDRARERVYEFMAALPEAEKLTPLLSSVLQVELPDNELTAQLSGAARAENIDRLLLAVLRHDLEGRPTALVLDDAHWLDPASWRLLTQVAVSVRPLLTVLALRSEVGVEPVEEYGMLMEIPETRVLRLEGLAASEITDLACNHLGVRELPAALHDFIRDRSIGHPFFCEELLRTMREVGVVRVVGDRCVVGDLESLELPTTIEGVILGRLDRLTLGQQLCLKVAAAAGPVFQSAVVRGVYPVASERDLIPDHLEVLAERGLLQNEPSGPEHVYRFKHQITRDVAYGLMTQSQTRPLHRSLAEWYERTHADELPAHYALLAHHWQLAGDMARTLGYLERAGELALQRGAFREALTFFSRAVELGGRDRAGMERRRRAAWNRGIGTSHYFLGDLERAQLHLEEAVADLHRPISRNPETVGRLVRSEVARQVRHRLFPARYLGSRATEKTELDHAVECYRVLGQIYYLNGEPSNRLVYLTLAGLNLGEEAGPSPALARILVNTSALLSLLGLARLSDWYGSRARAMAQAEGQYSAAAYVWHITALKHAQLGQWQAARAANGKAMELLRDLSDHNLEAEIWVVRATVLLCEGNFAAAPEAWGRARALAEKTGNTQVECWTLLDEAETLLGRGDVDAAESALSAGLAMPTADADGSSKVEKYRALAATRLAQGRIDEAQEAADAVMSLVSANPPTGYHWVDCAAAAVEVYLGVLSAGGIRDRRRREELMEKAAHGCRLVKRLSRTFGNVRPRSQLLQGFLYWEQGRRNRALRAWRKAEREASRMAMPFERARARLEIGRRGLVEESEALLNEAAATFRALGAEELLSAAVTAREKMAAPTGAGQLLERR